MTTLPADLRRTLAILDGCRRGLAELVLASLPLGSRMKLAREGIIKCDPEFSGRDLRLTWKGRRAIKRCRREADRVVNA